MNDNKLIFSLVIGVIVLFGLFMMLTGDDQEPVTVIVSDEPREPSPALPVMPEVTEEVTVADPEEIIEAIGEIIEPPVEEVIDVTEKLIAEVENVVEPEPVLPLLNNSDSYVREELATMDGTSSLLMYLVSDELVRKFVVMIENISRGEFPERNLPMLYPQERMTVTELGSEFYLMDEQSYQRFNALVTSLTNISTESAVDFYQQLQPLFREAYAELGLRNSEFNDVLMLAIDNVLNARMAPQPQQLIRPNLNYLYANPEIENYSDVEKLLLRLGPENTERLQRRLEFFKRRLELDSALNN
ncbi:MAG: DUF3014 domain-containing protein [Pseudohongiellaceae bacterium]